MIRFAIKNRLRSTFVKNLLDGKRNCHNGLFLKGKRPEFIRQGCRKTYIIEKNGKIFKVKNIAAFSRMVHISPSGFHKIIIGLQEKHCGWRILDIKKEYTKHKVYCN